MFLPHDSQVEQAAQVERIRRAIGASSADGEPTERATPGGLRLFRMIAVLDFTGRHAAAGRSGNSAGFESWVVAGIHLGSAAISRDRDASRMRPGTLPA
jgi:hypothetical protein